MGQALGEGRIDEVLPFTIPSRDVRGRVVRLGPVLHDILAAHDYPVSLRKLLGEALLLTAMMGTLLKDQGCQLTLQVQGQGGAVDLLVCDYREGELRGYVRHDPELLAAHDPLPSVDALFGKGYMAITFDLAATGKRYQGIVPLEGGSLAHVCEAYFAQSEQVPTLIRIGLDVEGDQCVAGGLLVQHLPDGEEGRERLHVRMDHPQWEHVSALAGSMTQGELVDPALALDDLIWRLFHEEDEVRLQGVSRLTRGCRCSADYYRSVLSRFSQEDLDEMRDSQGQIVVDCAFCSKVFPIAL
ncbi:MAG: Hsp33 family molecular chaperone HslO [Sphingomonadales bacterium]|nr:Hsp33 family molecular chaperone HslO [Sphingomonadales bacterium]MDE2169031.1 Hsp33 family molecular chaperone HslO [Sphingomonadales bacterium]